jgi:hypothetical protein
VTKIIKVFNFLQSQNVLHISVFLIADLDSGSDPGSRSLIRIQGTGESFSPSVIFVRLDPDLEGQ